MTKIAGQHSRSTDQATEALNSGKTLSGNEGFEDILIPLMEQLWKVSLDLCRHNMQDAEDLLQDAMLRAYRWKNSLLEAEYPYAWLRRVLLNTHLNRVRDNRKWDEREDLDEDLIPQGPVPHVLINSIDLYAWGDEVTRALNNLSELQRTLFIMADIENMSREEIATVTKLSPGTVSSRLFRARRKLAASLEIYAIKQGFLSAAALEKERGSMGMQ